MIDTSYRRLSMQEPGLLHGKKVLLRVDFNVPQDESGAIQDASRILEALPTIRFLHERGAAVMILSHFGRPKGKPDPKYTLDHVARKLEELIGLKVEKMDDCVGEAVRLRKTSLKSGDIVLLENTRFHLGETENLVSFSRELAEGMDVFVQDAFGCVHRAHASTEGVTHFLPSMMGFLLEKEFEALKGVFIDRKNPLTLVIGGAKIDTKIGIIRNFLPIADYILIGGGLANTFFYAKGYDVKDSLVEKDKAEIALKILQEAGEESCKIILAKDVIVAKEISNTAPTRIVHRKNAEPLEDGEKILDVGPESIRLFEEVIAKSETIIWNGPLGLFEYAPFEAGTRAIGQAIADNPNITIVGGGDSVDAINRFQFKHSHFSHISTGGGAMLEFLEGRMLPGISALRVQPTL